MNLFNFNKDDFKRDNVVVSDGYDFEKLYNESYVDLAEEMPPIKPLLSIGGRVYNGKFYDTYVSTEGEMSAVVAPSKTMKTFIATALVSAMAGGAEIEKRFPIFKKHLHEKFTILHFDTEQGKYYAQKTFRRVGEMSNLDNVNYVTFATRSMSADHRVRLIDDILKHQFMKYNEPVKLILIDGIADLVENTNDLVMSKIVSDYIMKWTHEYGIHIMNVIHKNFGDNNKPVGHIGSFVVKKAETVFLLKREDNGDILVTNDYSRGYPFESFTFNIDDHGLPYQTDAVEVINHEPSFANNNQNDIPF